MRGLHGATARLERLHQPGATRFLLLLVAVDAGFLVLDSLATFTDLLVDDMLSITKDGGYPELFQYIKFAWLVGLVAAVTVREQEGRYVVWTLLFLYLGLDDALQMHERLGTQAAVAFGFTDAWNLRAQDLGELAVSATAGVVLGCGLIAAVYRSSPEFRQASIDLLALLLLLVFFGVALDLAGMAVDLGPSLNRVAAAIEDWGEMIAVSLLTWYAFRLNALSPAERLQRGGIVRGPRP